LVCRTEHELGKDLKKKIALFCNVDANAVIESMDASTIYDVPMMMQEEKLDIVVMDKLHLPHKGKPNLDKWKTFLSRLKNPKTETTIALVGKYIELKDSYKSIVESIIHAGAANECRVKIEWIKAEDVTAKNVASLLKNAKGVIVAPGFGERGIEGKIEAIKYVRENDIPFLGICLGMQCAVIEFARNVLGLKRANSTEMDINTTDPVISLLEQQRAIVKKGGTMRLGQYACKLKKGSLALKIYGEERILERHRHRFEFNNEYLKDYEKAGMMATGINPDGKLVEIVEIPAHRWFVGVQFHPEYRSNVDRPHPLFVDFIKECNK
jgi:CTP synthase